MAESHCVTLAHAEPFELAPKVILGTVDVAAVGARVLLSLEPPPGWGVRETALELRGLQRPFAGSSSNSDGDNAVEGAGEPLRPVLAVAAATADREATPTSSSSSTSPSKLPVVILRNFYAPLPPATEAGAEAGAAGPRVTLLILNAIVSEGAHAEVAAAICDFLEGRRCRISAGESATAMEEVVAADRESHPAIEPLGTGIPAEGLTFPGGAREEAEHLLVVVAAMLLQQLAPPAAPLYQQTINGAASLDPTLPSLQPPPSTAGTASSGSGAGSDGSSRAGPPIRVRDGLLAALLHVLEVSGTRACCLLAPGYKPPAATPPDRLGSSAACDAIGGALAAAVGLQYSAEKCRSVRALYRWFLPEQSA
ncbi:hypothetical protein VaNZ11_006846, partial [Volvox africanus]